MSRASRLRIVSVAAIFGGKTGEESMVRSTADVATEHASKYLQQLCKHWSHKMVTEFDPASGRVDFPSGAQLYLEADSSSLHLKLDASEDSLTRMEGVVADHLKRFAFREELVFDWAKAA
jgi:uncharacterized protein